MKVTLTYQKRNYIFLAAALAAAVALYAASSCSICSIPLFGGAFYLLLSAHFTFSEKLAPLWAGILVLFGAVFTTFSVQYVILDNSLFVKMSALKWLLNILCVLAVYLFLLLCSNRPALSCLITHSFFVLFALADYFVYLFRNNELTFADLQSIGTGLSVAGTYEFVLTPHVVYILLLSALFLTLAAKCFSIRFSKRLPLSVVVVLLIAACCLFIGQNLGGISTETWEQKGTYRNGYILNFLLQIRDSFISAPEGYSAEAVAALEAYYSSDAAADDLADGENPTIIVIMNESYADLSVIGELKTNLPVTPFFDYLSENTIKGYALSSVFGAKTPNSEWEFLTGNSMAFLPNGSVVYEQYISSEPDSLISTLKNYGYTCVAMHPYYGSGWNRIGVYPTMGFDEMHFIEDFDQTKILRQYITDQELYEEIIARYEQKEAGESLCILGVTMQNHGGYTTTYDNFEEKYYKTGTSYTDLNQYLSLLHASDDALEELILYFSDVTDPVEIVFFGDHQPSLNAGFYKMMNGKGLSGLTKSELMDMYKVPFFIWTNYESKEESVEITSLNYLSTLALQKADLPLPAYNRFLADLMQVVPAVNSRGYYSLSAGKYQNITDAKGEEAAWLLAYQILQYNGMFDEKGKSNLFFPYLSGE